MASIFSSRLAIRWISPVSVFFLSNHGSDCGSTPMLVIVGVSVLRLTAFCRGSGNFPCDMRVRMVVAVVLKCFASLPIPFGPMAMFFMSLYNRFCFPPRMPGPLGWLLLPGYGWVARASARVFSIGRSLGWGRFPLLMWWYMVLVKTP